MTKIDKNLDRSDRLSESFWQVHDGKGKVWIDKFQYCEGMPKEVCAFI